MAIIRDLRNMHIYCQNIMIDKKDGYLNFLSCFVFIFTYSSQIGVIFFYFSYRGFFCRRLTVYFTISRQYNYTHDVKLDAKCFLHSSRLDRTYIQKSPRILSLQNYDCKITITQEKNYRSLKEHDIIKW